MKSWSTDRKIRLVFTLAFALLSAIPVVVYTNKQRLEDANHWIAHTYEVIATLESTMRSLADAETGQRGYLITGRDSYLSSYEVCSFQIKNLQAKLLDLTADNPDQQHRLDIIKPKVLAKL